MPIGSKPEPGPIVVRIVAPIVFRIVAPIVVRIIAPMLVRIVTRLVFSIERAALPHVPVFLQTPVALWQSTLELFLWSAFISSPSRALCAEFRHPVASLTKRIGPRYVSDSGLCCFTGLPA